MATLHVGATDGVGTDGTNGKVGIGTTSPNSLLHVTGGIQFANDTYPAGSSKAGTMRYYTMGNNSYVDVCMQVGPSMYLWRTVVKCSW